MSDCLDLTQPDCQSCKAGASLLAQSEIDSLLKQLPGWLQIGNTLTKTYPFKNYYQTLAFVNASAWISHRQDHHPDLNVGYNQCVVTYTTHAVNGLTLNDFICAYKVESLFLF
jgi:4a-hydroxytetrahydrobiopterin dehydratase